MISPEASLPAVDRAYGAVRLACGKVGGRQATEAADCTCAGRGAWSEESRQLSSLRCGRCMVRGVASSALLRLVPAPPACCTTEAGGPQGLGRAASRASDGARVGSGGWSLMSVCRQSGGHHVSDGYREGSGLQIGGEAVKPVMHAGGYDEAVSKVFAAGLLQPSAWPCSSVSWYS